MIRSRGADNEPEIGPGSGQAILDLDWGCGWFDAIQTMNWESHARLQTGHHGGCDIKEQDGQPGFYYVTGVTLVNRSGSNLQGLGQGCSWCCWSMPLSP
jgi:hypothetical protein